MGLLPDRSLRDPADRRPAHAAPQAGDEEGGPLTYPGGDPIDQCVHLGREVIGAGLAIGSGGNLSARSPGAHECVVTAAGTWLDRLDRTSFVRVRIADGVAPQGATPSSEVGLHLSVYRARPDVNAVVHLHPQTAVLLDALGVAVRLITTDHAFYLRRVAVTPWHAPGTPGVGEAVAEAVADGTNCVLLPSTAAPCWARPWRWRTGARPISKRPPGSPTRLSC
ncbi:class II aldolase/adducin family protein [Luedemannella flava]